MQTSRIIHFDSINGEDQLDEVYSQLTGKPSHNYFTRIPLVNTLYNVSNIELSSIEFLNSTYNVRADNTSNLLGFKFLYQGIQNTLSIVLTPKNYTSISDLLVDINGELLSKISQKTTLSGFSITVSVNPKDSGKVVIKSNCDTSSGSMSVIESILSKYILGVSNSDLFINNVSTGFSSLLSSNNYNLQCDNYFNMTFSNINNSSSANADAKMVTFKIPLSVSYNEVLYYTSGANFAQCLLLESNRTISHLLVKITDRWGFPVYSTAGFSFSLTFYF